MLSSSFSFLGLTVCSPIMSKSILVSTKIRQQKQRYNALTQSPNKVKVQNQGWQYDTVRRNLRYASISAKKYGALIRYAFFVMVRERYVGALFEFAY